MSDNKKGKDDGGRETDVYLTQIRYLTERLDGYQLKCDELQRQKQDFEAQFNILQTEKKDIVEYLKRCLLEKEDEVEALTERLQTQRQAADEERDAAQLRHSQLRGDLQGRIEELTAENGRLATRLAILEEFQQQKEQLTSRMETLETQLTREEREHRTDVHKLEMEALLDKKRLKKALERRSADIAEQVRTQVAQNLSKLNTAAQQENVELKAELNQVSELVKALTVKNATLQGCTIQLGMTVDRLEKMLRMESHQSHVHKKVANQLTEKCQQLQEEQKNNRLDLQHIQAEHNDAVAETEALRQRQASLSVEHGNSRAEVHRLEVELLKEKRRSSRMKSIMQEASATLRRALMEATAEPESVALGREVMQKLLLDLNGAAQKEEPREKPDPAAASQNRVAPCPDGTAHLDPSSTVQFQLARYRAGDLCLVPPAAQKHRDTLPRMGRVPLLRKPSSQKNYAAAGPSSTRLN